jgi:hypothetical protein
MALAGLSDLIGAQDRVRGRGPASGAVTAYTVGFRRRD